MSSGAYEHRLRVAFITTSTRGKFESINYEKMESVLEGFLYWGHLKKVQAEVGSSLWKKLNCTRRCSTLTELRTGHCHVNWSHHNFGLSDTPYCPCGAEETVLHCLFECRFYERLPNCFLLRCAILLVWV